MAKTTKVDIEALMKEVQGLQTKATQGIDELLLEVKEVRRKAEERVDLLQEQIQTLNNLHHSATGRYYVSSPSKGPAASEDGKRTRLTTADKEALVAKLLAMLPDKGDGEGKGKAEIVAGGIPEKSYLTIIKAAGKSVVPVGERKNTRYYKK